MTDPTQLPTTHEELVALLEARRAALLDEVDARIAAAVAPLEAALDEAIKLGDAISLQMAGGQWLSADEGGPGKPDLPVTFSSNGAVAAWESFRVGKGQ